MKFVKVLIATMFAISRSFGQADQLYAELSEIDKRTNTDKIVISGKVFLSTPTYTIPLRATVEIKGTNITVTTNSEGFYQFHADPSLKKKKTIKLICRLPGKKPIKGHLKAPYLPRYYVNFDFAPET